MKICIDNTNVNNFESYLMDMEKSKITIEKYMRDCKKFLAFVGDKELSKKEVIAFKQYLMDSGYAVSSINSMLASVNSLLEFMERDDCRVKSLKFQRQTYMTEEKELTKDEYIRLLSAAGKNRQLNLILQTICGTGIRVSELKYITVEAVKSGEAAVRCKNKNRIILIPEKLSRLLKRYIHDRKIKSGPVFISHRGNPLDRSYIWKIMKSLCLKAKVVAEKVFPHNLRKLFARTFYTLEKDIAKLADVLGHGSIETTRIYIMTTCNEHRKKMEKLGLVI